ncbi:MAG: ATP-binding protein [Desulfotomaculaceae bacterium]|nr:ATP-binding protein [Desulfotomaculaceae bacterium]
MLSRQILTQISQALHAARGLTLYRGIMEDPVCGAMVVFLEKVASQAPLEQILDSYGEIFRLLSVQAIVAQEKPVGDAWQNHLLNLILYQDNPFSEAAASAPYEQLSCSLKQAAMWDLNKLQVLHRIEAGAALASLLKMEDESFLAGCLPLWDDLHIVSETGRYDRPKARELKEMLSGRGNWSACLEALAAYYRCAGSGIFGRYGAFRWVSRYEKLEGIDEPDPVCLEELIGYQAQRQEVVANTEKFLAGLPANNILLYGDRGTGKSSTVKALLNCYQTRGLRLIEVPKSALGDYPLIIRKLRGKSLRFILFVDDLSFEDSEVEYKELKAVLEGGLEVRPDNVLIYATSNRRHLVREHFSDRGSAGDGDGDLRAGDTVQEKLSLADRFGIMVLFVMPDRSLYLDIVRGLAEQRGIDIPGSDLDKKALLWATWHNGRSGRTARQFIDDLSGELGKQKNNKFS